MILSLSEAIIGLPHQMDKYINNIITQKTAYFFSSLKPLCSNQFNSMHFPCIIYSYKHHRFGNSHMIIVKEASVIRDSCLSV
jgi:hypothetical protein